MAARPSRSSPSPRAGASWTSCWSARARWRPRRALGVSQPGVSKHLRILREAGFVESRQDAQRRFYECAPRRSRRSTRGSPPTGGCGPSRSTPSSATSMRPPTTTTRSRHDPQTPITTHPADGTLETATAGTCCATSAGSPTRSTGSGRRSPSPAEMRGWLADAEIDLVPAAACGCAGCNTDDEGNEAVATGQVTALDPPRLVEFDHRAARRAALRAARERRRHGADVHRHDARAERADHAGARRLAHPPRAPRRRARRPPRRLAALGREHRPRWDEIHADYA